MDQVLILLATYNGSKYIAEMIESILKQDDPNWSMVLSDDQSSDDTAAILEAYSRKYPDRIFHYRSGIHFGSAQYHFMHLLKTFHDAPYIMFCDQDDVWHADKIRKTLSKMKEVETVGKPAMVHTDLRVVDQDLRELHPSFIRYSKLDGRRTELHHLLMQNVATGCTMMINRPLAEMATAAIPEENMLMHDWWLALIASALGTVGYLDEATIDYRQHGGNAVGAKNVRSLRYVVRKWASHTAQNSINAAARQAGAFRHTFAPYLSPDQIELLTEFEKIPYVSQAERNRIYRRYKLYKYGALRVIAQFIGGPCDAAGN